MDANVLQTLAVLSEQAVSFDRYHHRSEPVLDNRMTSIVCEIVAALSSPTFASGSLAVEALPPSTAQPTAPPVAVFKAQSLRHEFMFKLYNTFFAPILATDSGYSGSYSETRGSAVGPARVGAPSGLQILYTRACVVNALIRILSHTASAQPDLQGRQDSHRWDDAELDEHWPWWELFQRFTTIGKLRSDKSAAATSWIVRLFCKLTVWAQGLSDTTIQAVGEDRVHELQRRCLRSGCRLLQMVRDGILNDPLDDVVNAAAHLLSQWTLPDDGDDGDNDDDDEDEEDSGHVNGPNQPFSVMDDCSPCGRVHRFNGRVGDMSRHNRSHKSATLYTLFSIDVHTTQRRDESRWLRT